MPSLPRRLSVGRVSASFYCSPHPSADLDPQPAIIESFQAARRTVLFSIYSFTSKPIAQALAEAATRGVQLTGVVDRSQEHSVYGMADWLASHENVHINRSDNTGLMHNKGFVVDGGKRIAIGSYNWTAGAEKKNDEILLISHGRAGSKFAEAMTNSIMTAFLQGTPIIAK